MAPLAMPGCAVQVRRDPPLLGLQALLHPPHVLRQRVRLQQLSDLQNENSGPRGPGRRLDRSDADVRPKQAIWVSLGPPFSLGGQALTQS